MPLKLQYAEITKSANFTAEAGDSYVTTASATVTDPASPVNGQSYTVRVSAGTATVGGVGYAVAGSVITRSYNAGAWANNAGESPALTAGLALKVDSSEVGSGANQIPRLDSNGDLVGPIIGRMMLAGDNVVPALGEQCTLVDSLTAPTIFEPRLGDGVTVLGIARPDITSAQVASKLGDVLIASLQRMWPANAGTAHYATAELEEDVVSVKTSTGYARLINPDGSLGSQAGTGVAGTQFEVTVPAGSGLRAYGIVSVANGGSVRSGNITSLNFYGFFSKIVSFSGTSLSAVTFLGFSNNRLTSFTTTGLTALVTLILTANLLTSFNGAGLTAMDNLSLQGNPVTSVRLVGLTLLAQTSSSASSYGAAVDVQFCTLNATALNQMYSDLGNGTGFILISGNPGASGDTPSIATGKGYVVVS